jgi:hypothetical protein
MRNGLYAPIRMHTRSKIVYRHGKSVRYDCQRSIAPGRRPVRDAAAEGDSLLRTGVGPASGQP